MKSQSRPTECKFPNNTALTGDAYGCTCVRCKDAKRVSAAKWREKNSDHYKKHAKEYLIKIKQETFLAYGGLVCNCCGEKTFKFLSLDHVFNDGFKEHNKAKYRCAGISMYLKLRRNGYPDKDRYQVLCMNCNFGKKLNGGICPHKG